MQTRMILEPGEPAVVEWRVLPLKEFRDAIEARRPVARPLIVAIDGRSAAGKSTLARNLAALFVDATIVHTDDLAWYEPLFEWSHLLREGILAPARGGDRVSFTPPAWSARGRQGSIELPAGVATLIVEGVGAAHASTARLVDVVIWVQSDRDEAERRGLERDIASGENGDEEATRAFWHEWGAAERDYLALDRPWERADFVVAGTPPYPVPDGMLAVAGNRW